LIIDVDKMKSREKIFLGLTNIASQLNDFKIGFDKIGYETLSVVKQDYSVITNSNLNFNIENSVTEKFGDSNSVISKAKKKVYRQYLNQFLFKKALNECDIFFFMWNSFFEDNRDFKILKKRNKKIVTFLCGDDVRWKSSYEQEFKEYNLPLIEYRNEEDFSLKILNKRLAYLRYVEKYSDVILSVPNQSQLGLKPYNNNFVPINLELINYSTYQNEFNPLIIHGSSRRDGSKGTKYVMDVINRLQIDGIKFNFKLIENLPYSDALKFYLQSDIAIGQLLGPGGGKQEREFLACGKVVLASMRYAYPQGISSDCPVIDIGPENLYEKLKEIILDYPTRVELAKKGRPWVEKYHDVNKICKNLITRLETEDDKMDFYPTFFRDKFIPESDNALKIYNKWNRFVNECDWYKEYIPAGERDGLIF
jgi:hypothetical protein